MATTVTLSWNVKKNQISRELHLPEGSVLLSEYYLQNLLPPTCKFVSLFAIVQFGEIKTQMEIPSHKDIDGNNHFLLETTLSKEFFMEHTETMFIADSDDDKLNDFSFDSTPKYSGTCVEISDEVFRKRYSAWR